MQSEQTTVVVRPIETGANSTHTVAELAAALGHSQSTICAWVRRGRLAAIKQFDSEQRVWRWCISHEEYQRVLNEEQGEWLAADEAIALIGCPYKTLLNLA